jgi:hypothetical protein
MFHVFSRDMLNQVLYREPMMRFQLVAYLPVGRFGEKVCW